MHAYIGMAVEHGGTQLLRVPRPATRSSSFTFAIASPRVPLRHRRLSSKNKPGVAQAGSGAGLMRK
jgi:hypothetical protein